MSDSAFQIQYRQEFIQAFEQHATLLRDTVTTEAVIKGNQAVFLVAGSGAATAVSTRLFGQEIDFAAPWAFALVALVLVAAHCHDRVLRCAPGAWAPVLQSELDRTLAGATPAGTRPVVIEWLAALRLVCATTSQGRAAEQLGISEATVSQVLSGTYKAATTRIERRVRGELEQPDFLRPAVQRSGCGRRDRQQRRAGVQPSQRRMGGFMARRLPDTLLVVEIEYRGRRAVDIRHTRWVGLLANGWLRGFQRSHYHGADDPGLLRRPAGARLQG